MLDALFVEAVIIMMTIITCIYIFDDPLSIIYLSSIHIILKYLLGPMCIPLSMKILVNLMLGLAKTSFGLIS